MKNMLKTSLTLTLHVEVEYEKLEEDKAHGLPEQIDLTAVNFRVIGKTGRKRKVDILGILDDCEVIELEDQAHTGERNDN